MWIAVIGVVILGYLIGSLPSAYIAGRVVKGVDIRQVGGGNMGTLNAMRELGVIPGIGVLVADIGKGAVAVLAARWLVGGNITVMTAGFASILGHNFPVYLKFRGGKGAATAIGVFLALAPAETGMALGALVIIILATSNLTLGLAVGFVLMPLILWLRAKGAGLVYFSLVIAVAEGIRYLPTLKRTLSDAEGRKNVIIEKRFYPWQARKKR